MCKQFGDDPNTLKVIRNVIQLYVKDGSQLQAKDLDNVEQDIFQRLSNTNNNIALDVFHPRLVEKAERRKLSGFDKFGGTKLESKEFRFGAEMSPEKVKTPTVTTGAARAQTSN